MTDSPPSEESSAPDEEGEDDPSPTLEDLRFVGPSTARALEAASITAEDLLEHEVSFVRLVDLDVDPGVAARLRREYSLPWADEPTTGARLRRRAGHIRHLRDDERSWIDASGATERGEEAGAATDGGGSATDAERAWRERGRKAAPATETANDGETSPGDDGAPPFDPKTHTVPELEEALDGIDDPTALAALLRAERDGDDRVTALDAIEARLEAIGIDPADLPKEPTASPLDRVEGALTTARARLEDLDLGALGDPNRRTAALTKGGAVLDDARATLEALMARTRDVASERAVAVRAAVRDFAGEHPATGSEGSGDVQPVLAERTSAIRTVLTHAIERVEEQARTYDARLRAVEDREWRRLSVALLLGIISFSAMAAVLVALQSAGGGGGLAATLVVTVVAGAMSIPLRWWEATGGHALTLLTGLLALGAVGLFSAPDASPPGAASALLPVYAMVAGALVVATALSWGDWYGKRTD